MDYRERIYRDYVSLWQGGKTPFDESAARQWGKSYDYFSKRVLPQDKSAAILDVACGGGNLLYYLKSKGYSNTRGVDLSPEQVCLARQVIDGVALQDAVDYLKDHRDEFDLIIGLDIIEHFTKDETLLFLDAIREALRAEGRVVLQTPNAAGFMGASMRFADFTHEVGLTPGCLENLLRLTGFGAYSAWERGPAPHGLTSFVRFCTWQLVRLVPMICDYIEEGGTQYAVYTRVFIASAVKESGQKEDVST